VSVPVAETIRPLITESKSITKIMGQEIFVFAISEVVPLTIFFVAVTKIVGFVRPMVLAVTNINR